MGKIQKEPGSMPKGLEFSYNGKSGMIPNYVTTPFDISWPHGHFSLFQKNACRVKCMFETRQL